MPSVLFRDWWKIFAAITVLAAVMLAGAPNASAHDQLISTVPAHNAQLDTAPSKLTLTFSAKLLKLGNEVVLADAKGSNWSSGKSTLDGDTMSQQLKPGLPQGQYEARWRVISSDGHPISGSFRFAIREPVNGDSLLPDVTESAIPTSTPSVAATVPEVAAEPVGSWWSQPWLLWASIGAAIGILAYLVYIAVSNARKNDN
ncbi:copper resistance protein CopC [Psychromicrobium sp. YIM B11713]|uniref:copper resistance CopC family protein n=1 Tax=Psychromicrobium sp. YIM B11713 TaxID=3145233 RepID=UPI00374EE9FC